MKKRFLLLTLLSLSYLQAEHLTMQESIDSTLLNHPDIKSFMLKIEQSKKGYESAKADYLPQVNVQANYNPLQTYALPVNGTFNTLDDDGWGGGVVLKQKIWDFGKTSSIVEASKIDEDISKLSLDEAKALLAYKVKSLYNLMVLQQEAILVHQKDVETKEAMYRQAKGLLKQGLKTKADMSRFLSALYVAKDNVAMAKASFEKAKSTLSLYMAKPISNHVTLEKERIKEELSENSSSDAILKENYQLKIDSLNIEKNRLLHKASKASHYGSVDAQASYNHLDTLNSYDSKLLGVTLNIPLYSGGKLSAQSQKAKIATQIAKEKEASKKIILKDEIAGLLIDIRRYESTITAKKAQLITAKETKRVLDARYKEGLTTYIELLDATKDVLGASLGLLEAYYSKTLAIYKIDYLRGKI
jgi:outer membrane protein TolC